MKFVFLALSFVSSVTLACSAFRMPVNEGRVLVGRNFDWDYGHGLMMINKRGVAKHSLSLHASDTATWTSKYGSLTFNQAAREMPYGGMNEKGLMLEVLWLGWTKWPTTAAPSMNEVQWIQYQLDNRASVADLIEHIDDVRIESVFAKVHFIACDASGECATIEGLGNHIEIHHGASMPMAALTNDTYENSLKFASPVLQGGKCSSINTKSSLDRFAQSACGATEEIAGESTLDETARVNTILDQVAQGDYTKWQIVYDLKNRTISLRTHEAAQPKIVKLDAFDLSCASLVKVFDMNEAAQGEVSTSFVDYTPALNRSIVERSLLNGFAHLPQGVVDRIVAFPDTLACVQP